MITRWRTTLGQLSSIPHLPRVGQTEGRSNKISLGHDDLAKTDLDRAIELDPAKGFAYLERGKIYLGRNQTQEALADFSHATDLMPATAEV